MSPTRPVLRWHGGKWLLAPWIIEHMPPHQVYVEPFSGAASVLLRKPRSYAEIVNDIDGGVVELFRVLRSPEMAARLVELLKLTPFARTEREAALRPSKGADIVERSRCLIVRSFMGFGSDASRADVSTGFRANSNRSGTTPAQDWGNYPDALAATIDRLRGVVIEHRDAKQVMATHDGADTLHYVDPPYMHNTRKRVGKGRGYAHEMTDADHAELVAFLRSLKGMVMLSGYQNSAYDDALGDWRRFDFNTFADGARPRLESLWLNPAAVAARDRAALPLLQLLAAG